MELYITFIHLVQISFYGSTMAQWLSPWPHRENVLGYPLCGSKVPISVIGCLWWCQSCEGLETSVPTNRTSESWDRIQLCHSPAKDHGWMNSLFVVKTSMATDNTSGTNMTGKVKKPYSYTTMDPLSKITNIKKKKEVDCQNKMHTNTNKQNKPASADNNHIKKKEKENK